MKTICATLILFVLTIFPCHLVLGQKPYFEEENFLTPVAGISLVNGIAADVNNCLWLSTQSGIYRYDGNKFKQYSTLNTAVLRFERMESIQTVLKDQSVEWCIKDAKANLYQTDSLGQIQPFKLNSGFQIIFGPHNLQVWQGQKKIPLNYPLQIPFNVVYSSERELFYLVFDNGELAKISKKDLLEGKALKFLSYNLFTKKFTNSDLKIKPLFATNKALYILKEDGLIRLHDSFDEVTPVAFKGDILASGTSMNFENARIYAQVGSTSVLMWNDGNIFELKESVEDNTIETKLLVKSQPTDIPSFLFYSPERHLLFGSYLNRGLITYRPRQFSILAYADNVSTYSDNYYYTVLSDNDGYVSVSNAGMIHFDLNGGSKILYKGSVHKFFLFRDRAGNIWFQRGATLFQSSKVYYLEAGTNQPILVFDPGKGSGITGIYQPNDSVYYILTYVKLIKLVYRNKIPTAQVLYEGQKKFIFNVLYAKDEQTLWVGHDRGMLEYNLSDNSAKEIPALQNANIRTLTKLATGNYLLGTYDKWLYQYKNGKWTHLSTPDKATAASVHAFIIDSLTNSIWISSNKGVSRLPLRKIIEMNAKDTSGIYVEHFINFGKDISVEFNGSNNTSSAQFSKSSAAFTNASGLVVFDPQKTYSSPLPTNVLIEPVQNDDSIAQQKGVFRRLEFSVVVPYFGNRENLEILYKLTNSDETWHRLFPNSIISYNNLRPGDHELHFRIRHYGDVSGNEVFINAATFYTPFRWYETNLFRIGIVLVGFALFVGFHRFRIWYILKRKRVLEKIVIRRTSELQESNQKLVEAIDELTLSEAELKQSNFLKDEYYAVLTHDLRSPLKFLSFNISQLMEYAPELKDPTLKNGLFAAYQCSNDVYKLIDEFVYWIQNNEKQLKAQPAETTVLAVVEDAKKMYEHSFGTNNNKFTTRISPELKFTTDPKLLFIILRNAIDNANKYTQGGTISVTATKQHGMLEITVADTGRGISEEKRKLLMNLQYEEVQLSYKQRKSLGFYIMAMLTRKLNGSYAISSSMDRATQLVFSIPELENE